MHLHHFAALLTLDKTAPVEFTTASFHNLHLLCVEATTTTHELTTVNCLGRLIALTSRGPENPVLKVMVTEIWA